MKKILLTIMLGMVLISLASATADLGTFKQDDCIQLSQYCDDCTYVNLTKVQYPNGTIQTINSAMTKDDVNYNYTFCNTSESGDYFYTVKGDKGGEVTTERIGFKINYIGQELTDAQSTMYIILLVILILVLFGTIYGTNFLPSENTTNPEGNIISISWLKYLRLPLYIFIYFFLAGIIFLSSNLAFAYLGTELFGKLFFALFMILMALSPLIIILTFLSFFIKFYNDKEFKNYLNRGIFPGTEL